MEPFSRAKLQSLYAEELTRRHTETINTVVDYIYRHVIMFARSYSTVRKAEINVNHIIDNNSIIHEISKDAVSQLEKLFPDCKVLYNSKKTEDSPPDDVEHFITVDWA